MMPSSTNTESKGPHIDSNSFLCPECSGNHVIQKRRTGERVCAQCGLVVSEKQIDSGPEWRAFTAEERRARARTGAPTRYTIHDKGLSTTIDWRNRDSSGRKLSAKRRSEIHRLRKWQIRSRIHNSKERNLIQALTELDRLASQLQLKKSVKDLAAMIYRKALIRRATRTRPIDATVAAAIYAACRLREIPQSLKEIAKQSRIDWKKIGRHYRLLARRMNLKMPVPNPMNYVPKILSELNLPGSMQETVLEILQEAKENPGLVTGKDPRGLAAAAIYIASILTDNRVTQRNIARASGVTEVTVRNRYKELVRELEIAPS
ncbi:MAG: transcription initiation factor IIB [Candidatus Thorarchaeota archaeon]